MFELLDRDGYGRIGRLTTPHGTVRTPVLLPVIHPDPARQVLSPSEIRSTLGAEAVITSSYILRGRPELGERARSEGLHGLLDFPGTIMTDSGAFQQHVYGGVDVTPEEILEFQRAIGSDIVTPLDVFVEPDVPYAEAERGVVETLLRVRAAREQVGTRLLAVPVQGGLFPELRARSAQGSSPLADLLCVGGLVPLMESYRFAELVRMLADVRPFLSPERPVHLFGLGHPMLFALGALLGGDVFDTSSYHKFARRGSLLFPEGSMDLASVTEDFCGCSLCAELPLSRVARLPEDQRIRHLAAHNLRQCFLEIARVRQAIRDGELWELVERRSTAHPAMRAALLELRRHRELFLPVEPPSRTSFLVTSDASLERPAILRFERKLAAYREGRGSPSLTPFPGLGLRELERAPAAMRADPLSRTLWEVTTPIGPVPIELSGIYPVGPLLTPAEYAPEHRRSVPAEASPPPDTGPGSGAEQTGPETPLEPAPTSPGAHPTLALRHALGIIEWCWGRGVREALPLDRVEVHHSRSTGRMREILLDHEVAFIVGNDGLPHFTMAGGRWVQRLAPRPSYRVVAHADAVPFLREGRSLFSRHVVGADPAVPPGAYVLVVDEQDRLHAVGRAILAGSEMGRFSRGVAVRVTAHEHGPQ